MAKVQNPSGRTVPLARWKILPDGRCVDPLGKIGCCLPNDIAYGPRAKKLADQGVLKIEGYNLFEEPKKAEPAKPAEPEAPAEPDELTSLSQVGKGRAKKLNESGIMTFKAVASMGAYELSTLLEITEDTAKEIIDSAKGK